MSRPKPSSRENGCHSHGPKTQAGKDRSKFNALKHGLLAQKLIVVPPEKQEGFEQNLTEHTRRFQPRDEVENYFVIEMVRAQWNLFRSFMGETEIFSDAQSGVTDGRYWAAVFEKMASNRTLDLIPRYQARLQLAYQRALRNLILVRDNFPLPSEPPDQPDEREPESPTPVDWPKAA